MEAGLDIDEPSATQGTWKATPLWHAIAFGENVALAEYLLQRGADPNHCLWAAVNRNNPAVIRLLIQHGAKDPTTNKGSPLLAAVRWNKFAAAEELLQLGADANFQDSKKMTALHYVLKKKRDKKYVRMLIHYGARGDIKNADGATAAEIMIRKRDSDFRDMAAQLLVRS
jgi:ankyrin repeat protein